MSKPERTFEAESSSPARLIFMALGGLGGHFLEAISGQTVRTSNFGGGGVGAESEPQEAEPQSPTCGSRARPGVK